MARLLVKLPSRGKENLTTEEPKRLRDTDKHRYLAMLCKTFLNNPKNLKNK